MGKTDMPAIPKLFNICAEKGFIKIVWRYNSKNIAKSPSHETITRKVKEQIEPIGIHINPRRAKILAQAEIGHQKIKTRSQRKLINQPQTYFKKARPYIFQIIYS